MLCLVFASKLSMLVVYLFMLLLLHILLCHHNPSRNAIKGEVLPFYFNIVYKNPI